MEIRLDFSEATALGRQLEKIGKRGLKGDKLAVGQMKSIWRVTGKQITRVAAPTAPASGLTGKSVWSRGKYRYEGVHGDLQKQTKGYTVKPYQSGKGVRVFIGGDKKANERKKLAGLVGKFAVHGIKRAPGGGSTRDEFNNWLGAANRRASRAAAEILVETYNRALQHSLAASLPPNQRGA